MVGVVLLSASNVSIFFSRSMNSRRSAFSARMSVPSRVVMFTCAAEGGGERWAWPLTGGRGCPHLHHVIQTVEDVLPRLLGLDARLRLVLRRRLKGRNRFEAPAGADERSLTHLQPPQGVAGVGPPVEEPAAFGSSAQQVLGRKPLGLRDVANLRGQEATSAVAPGKGRLSRNGYDLVVLRGSGIKRPSQEELGDHTPQGPHVDGLAEREAQDDLWSSAGTSQT